MNQIFKFDKIIFILFINLNSINMCLADSPLTSTKFCNAYIDNIIVANAIKSDGKLTISQMDYLVNEKIPVDEKMALINALGWDIDNKENAELFYNYLKKNDPEITEDNLPHKLKPEVLLSYTYLLALDNYFDVNEASSLAQIVMNTKPKSYTFSIICSLIFVQNNMMDSFCEVNNLTNELSTKSTLIIDLREEAIEIIFDYMSGYYDYCEQGVEDIVYTSLESAYDDPNNVKYLSLAGFDWEKFDDSLVNFKNLLSVDLSGNLLNTLPKSFSKNINLVSLELGTNSFKVFPECILDLYNLKYLTLSSNQISSLPDSLQKLKSLELIFLDDNPIINFPNNLTLLSNLKFLELNNCQLISCPNEIGDFSVIEEISLNSNSIPFIPETIGNLTKLTKLSLNENKIEILPNSIGNLINLTKLDIGNNNINKLPSSLINLKHLRILNLNSNPLQNYPEIINELTSLEILEIANCNFFTIPSSIEKLINLKEINLNSSKLTVLPEAIIKLTNLKSLYLMDNDFSEQEKKRIKELFPKAHIYF